MLGLGVSTGSAVGIIEGSVEVVLPHLDYLFLTGAPGAAAWVGFGGIFGRAGGCVFFTSYLSSSESTSSLNFKSLAFTFLIAIFLALSS